MHSSSPWQTFTCARGVAIAALAASLSLGVSPVAAAHVGQPPESSEAVEAPASSAPSAPSAPSDEQRRIALAKEKVRAGQALYDQARYEEALASFQDAAAAYASPDFQFNIGLCYERLGETRPAISAFETYLRNKPDAADRAGVEHRIEQLRAQLEAAENPTPRPTPAVELTPPPPELTPPPVESDDGGRDPKPLIVTGAVLVGVGAAVAIGGGLGFGLPANDRATQVDGVLNGGNPDALTRAQTESLAKDGDLLRTGQFASIGLGAALVITGTALLATGLRRKRNTNVALVLDQRIVGLTASTRF